MGSTYSPPRGLFLATSEDFDMAMDNLEADNLVWLLGAYVETRNAQAPGLRYLID